MRMLYVCCLSALPPSSVAQVFTFSLKSQITLIGGGDSQLINFTLVPCKPESSVGVSLV